MKQYYAERNGLIQDKLSLSLDDLKAYFNHFLTKELLSLFSQTFGKDGRNDPTSRPSMREWYSVLKELSLKLNLCECGAFIYAGEKICGWVVSYKSGERFYFDSKEEAEFFTNGALHCKVLPVYCDEVEE